MSDSAKTSQNSEGSTPVKRSGFTSTMLGKIVAIVIGLCILSVVIGIAAAVVLHFIGESSDYTVNVQTDSAMTASQTSGVTEAAETEVPESVQPAAELLNKAVFTFRDIFEPLILPLPEESSTTTDSSSDDSTSTPVASGALLLQQITTDNGVLKAVLVLDGETYTLAAGEGIAGTPWEVLSVSSTSVTMLYGDIQVVLSVGQAVVK